MWTFYSKFIIAVLIAAIVEISYVNSIHIFVNPVDSLPDTSSEHTHSIRAVGAAISPHLLATHETSLLRERYRRTSDPDEARVMIDNFWRNYRVPGNKVYGETKPYARSKDSEQEEASVPMPETTTKSSEPTKEEASVPMPETTTKSSEPQKEEPSDQKQDATAEAPETPLDEKPDPPAPKNDVEKEDDTQNAVDDKISSRSRDNKVIGNQYNSMDSQRLGQDDNMYPTVLEGSPLLYIQEPDPINFEPKYPPPMPQYYPGLGASAITYPNGAKNPLNPNAPVLVNQVTLGQDPYGQRQYQSPATPTLSGNFPNPVYPPPPVVPTYSMGYVANTYPNTGLAYAVPQPSSSYPSYSQTPTKNLPVYPAIRAAAAPSTPILTYPYHK